MGFIDEIRRLARPYEDEEDEEEDDRNKWHPRAAELSPRHGNALPLNPKEILFRTSALLQDKELTLIRVPPEQFYTVSAAAANINFCFLIFSQLCKF